MGRYHPHGDTAIYDALVRMAQDFSLRYPLVDGHGNFGSLDGDSAAAMRYTECRLTALATDLLARARQRDGRLPAHLRREHPSEPVVLPALVPQLLMNGTTGIAVGMATNIPPHNVGELCDALIALVKDPKLETKDLLKYVKGPDFPTGAQVLNSKKELREIYETGQGAIRVRGEWKLEELPRGRAADRHHLDPLRGQQVEPGRRRSATWCGSGSSPRSPTCATRAPTTCGSCWRSSGTPAPRWSWRTCSSTRRCRPTSTST